MSLSDILINQMVSLRELTFYNCSYYYQISFNLLTLKQRISDHFVLINTSDDINKLLLEAHDLCKLYAVVSYTYTTFYHLAHSVPYTYMEKYNLHSLCRLYVVVSLSHEYNTSLCGVYHLLSAYVFIVYRTYVINVLYGIITICIFKFVLSLY